MPALPEAERSALVADLANMTAEFGAVALPAGDDSWSKEMREGIQVTTLRARFIAALYTAAADPTAAEPFLVEADAALEEARGVVSRRHAALHDDVGGRLTVRGENPTLYPFGYLYWADELCYWEREAAQASNLLRGTSVEVPSCAL